MFRPDAFPFVNDPLVEYMFQATNRFAVEANQIERNPVLLVGAGALGSWIATLLVRMGVRDIRIIDHDLVEAANVGIQAYTLADVGMHKCSALINKLLPINPRLDYKFCLDKITSRRGLHRMVNVLEDPEPRVIIPALDNARTRLQVFSSWSARRADPIVLIDPRTGYDSYEVWALAHDMKSYQVRKRLYKNSLIRGLEMPPAQCGRESIIYTSLMCAARVAWTVAQVSLDASKIPFYTRLDTQTLHLDKWSTLGEDSNVSLAPLVPRKGRQPRAENKGVVPEDGPGVE